MADNGNDWVVRLKADISDYTRKIDEAVAKMSSSAAQIDKYKAQIADSKKYKSDGIGKMAAEMQGLIKQYQSHTSAIFKVTGQMASIESKIGAQAKIYSEQKLKIDETAAAYDKQKQAISETENAIAKSESKLLSYTRQLEAFKNGTQLDFSGAQEKIKNHIKDLTNLLKVQNDRLVQQEKEAAKISGSMGRLQGDYESTGNKLKELNAEYAQSAQKAQDLAAAINETGSKMVVLSTKIGTTMELEKTNAKIKGLSAALLDVGKKGATIFVRAFRKVGSVLKSVASRIVGTIRDHKLLTGASQKLGRVFNSLGSIFKRTLARMAIRAVFSQISNAMKSMALQFNSFNAAMSSMGSSSHQLTAQIVSAFAPLLETVAPIINHLIGLINSLASAISQLSALLGGGTTWRRAVKTAYDYSGAMDAAASGAGSAKKEQDELNRSIMSFDVIHKLNEKDDSSGGGGGGSALDDASMYQWVEEEIPQNKFTAWADKLAEAFHSHDWKGLGATLAEGVNAGFAWLENLTKWDNAGQKIREINTGISDSFNSFMERVNWEDLGGTIGGAITTGLKAIQDLQDKIDFKLIGTSISEGLNGFISKLQLSDITTAITNAINGAFEILDGFNSTIKWDELGKNISAGLTNLFTTFDWEGNAAAISGFVTGMLSSLGTTLEKTDWEAVGAGIVAGLEEIKWKEILQGVVDLIVGVFTAGFSVIGGGLKEAFGSDEVTDAIEASTEKIRETNAELEKNLRLSERKLQMELVKEDYKAAIEAEKAARENLTNAQQKQAEEQAKYNEKQQLYSQFTYGSNAIANAGIQAGQDISGFIDSQALEKANDVLEDAQEAYQDAVANSRNFAEVYYAALNGTSSAQDRNTNSTNKSSAALQKNGKLLKRSVPTLKNTKNAYRNTANSVERFGRALGQNTTQMSSAVMYKIKPLAQQIPLTFRDGLNGATAEFKRHIPQFETQGTQAGKKVIAGITGALKESKTKLAGASEEVGTALTKGFNAKTTLDTAHTAGKTLGGKVSVGFAEGITIDKSSTTNKLKKSLAIDLSGEGRKVGHTFGNALKEAIETTHIKTPRLATSGVNSIAMGGGSISKVPNYVVEWYGKGGFPDVGSLFIANEKGPEMVGTMGGKPAVANNQQIIKGVAEGVRDAVSDILMQYAAQTHRDEGGDLIIRIDSEEIYRATLKGQRKYSKRTSPVFQTF